MRIPTRSPSPSIDVISSMRLNNAEASAPAVPEHELAAMEKKNQANANALTLELVGDLPFAEVKPPENVLFVAKLNPVTTEPDLNMIFSRFGKCLVKLVKDGESGKSLGYAFIGIYIDSPDSILEYDDQEAAEQAFFKMDKCLIDDARIHVDFSQSVARVGLDEGKKGGGEDFGGEGLRRRRMYRNDESRYGKDYEMVWEKKNVEEEEDKSGSIEKRRERSRSPRRSRSPNRRERSRSPSRKPRSGSPPSRRRDSRSRSPRGRR
jgi:peptidyl-prolyl cis-trans isomerase-like 4